MSEQLDLFGHKVGLKEIKRTKAEVFEDYNSFVDKFETQGRRIRNSTPRPASVPKLCYLNREESTPTREKM